MSINISGKILSSSGYTANGEIIQLGIITKNLVGYWDAGHLASYSMPSTYSGATYYNCGGGCQHYSSDPGCPSCVDQILDMSGYGNDGTFHSSGLVSVAFENVGPVLDFPGTSYSYISCGNDQSLQCPNEVTMMGWVKPEAVANQGNIFNNNFNSGWRCRITFAKQLWFYVAGNSVSGGDIELNKWTHICCVGNSSGLAVYVNAIQVNSNTNAFSPTAVNGLIIGAYNSTGEIFNGQMGQLLLYNRRLSLGEIITNYNAGISRFAFSNQF